MWARIGLIVRVPYVQHVVEDWTPWIVAKFFEQNEKCALAAYISISVEDT